MLEECFCCGAFAPSWDADEYADWELELASDGAYLGVICPGCFAGEGLAFLDAEPVAAAVVKLRVVGGAKPRGGSRLAEAA